MTQWDEIRAHLTEIIDVIHKNEDALQELVAIADKNIISPKNIIITGQKR